MVRITDDIGLNFRKIDMDSLVHSDTAVTTTGADRQGVIEEFYGFIEKD